MEINSKLATMTVASEQLWETFSGPLHQFILEISTTDFLEHRDETVSHLRLFDLRFLKQRNCRGADVDELPADGTDFRGDLAALGRVLGDQLFARRLGQGGRKAVETYYNWDRVIRDLREIEAQVA